MRSQPYDINLWRLLNYQGHQKPGNIIRLCISPSYDINVILILTSFPLKIVTNLSMSSVNNNVVGLLAINVDLAVDEDLPRWILCLIFIQALLTFVAIGGLLLFLIVYRKRNLFHKNLKILLANAALLWLIMMSCRFTIATAGLFNWRIIGLIDLFPL